MSKPLRILLVDDKKDYCESLSGVARHNNIQLEYKLDWETGFELLRNDPTIEFVILDGKGKIEADQETEKDNFVIRAMRDIDTYSTQIGKHIPYCVNTGFIDRFEALEDNVKIFEKKDSDRDLMFKYIAEQIAISNYRTARIDFEEAFVAFDKGIISRDFESILVSIINAYKDRDYRKVNLNAQRDFLEGIFISLNREIPCIPPALFKGNGLPNHESCTRFMEDRNANGHKLNKGVPQEIKSAFRKLKESTNGYSHLSDEDIVKTPFRANIHLIMEILEWLPEFVETNYNNHI